MAGHGAKRLAAANASRLANLRRGMLGSAGFYALLLIGRWLLGWPVAGVTSAGASLGAGLLALRALSTAGQAMRDAQGKVVDGGADLATQGYYSYAHDVVYLACACLVLGSLHPAFFYLWVLVPLYVAYYAATFVLPMLVGGRRGEAQAGGSEDRQANQRRQLTAEERKAKRAQVRRIQSRR